MTTWYNYAVCFPGHTESSKFIKLKSKGMLYQVHFIGKKLAEEQVPVELKPCSILHIKRYSIDVFLLIANMQYGAAEQRIVIGEQTKKHIGIGATDLFVQVLK